LGFGNEGRFDEPGGAEAIDFISLYGVSRGCQNHLGKATIARHFKSMHYLSCEQQNALEIRRRNELGEGSL
jgi:hypothetical protein